MRVFFSRGGRGGGGDRRQLLPALKIDLYRDGEPIATLTEFDDLTATDTSISFHLNTNSSSHPDGDWWGQCVLLTATIGGFAVKRWLTFANPMP